MSLANGADDFGHSEQGANVIVNLVGKLLSTAREETCQIVTLEMLL